MNKSRATTQPISFDPPHTHPLPLAFRTKGRGIPAFPGSLKMDSYEDGMVVLQNWSEGQQYLDGCYLRLKGGVHWTAPLPAGQQLKAGESVTLKAPPFLSLGHHRAQADKDSQRWFGGDFGMPAPKPSQVPAAGVVELVSVHHMGKVVCEVPYGSDGGNGGKGDGDGGGDGDSDSDSDGDSLDL